MLKTLGRLNMAEGKMKCQDSSFQSGWVSEHIAYRPILPRREHPVREPDSTARSKRAGLQKTRGFRV